MFLGVPECKAEALFFQPLPGLCLVETLKIRNFDQGGRRFRGFFVIVSK